MRIECDSSSFRLLQYDSKARWVAEKNTEAPRTATALEEPPLRHGRLRLEQIEYTNAVAVLRASVFLRASSCCGTAIRAHKPLLRQLLSEVSVVQLSCEITDDRCVVVPEQALDVLHAAD